MADTTPLVAYLQLDQKANNAINAALRQALKEIDASLASLTNDTITGKITRVQAEAQKAAIQAHLNTDFSRIGTMIGNAQAASARAASKVVSGYEDELLALHLSPSQLADVAASEAGRAAAGIQNLLARKVSSYIPLKEQVYKTGQIVSGQIDKIVDVQLAKGATAAEFAKAVHDFVNPATPGGAAYAARRLARTEINNAFHAASIDRMQNSGLVDEVEWNLSLRHFQPDICDVFHAKSPYPILEVPMKPHPQDLCYITPVLLTPEQFMQNLLGGAYDDPSDFPGGKDPAWKKELVKGLEIAANVLPLVPEIGSELGLGARAAEVGLSEATPLLELEGQLALEAAQDGKYVEFYEQLELTAGRDYGMLAIEGSQSAEEKAALDAAIRDSSRVPTLPSKLISAEELGAIDVETEAGAAELETEFKTMYEGKDFNGFKLKVDKVWGPAGGGTEVDMAVYDAAGKQVGTVERIFYANGDGTYSVQHELMKLDPEAQGKGFSTAFSAYSEAMYKQMGINNVDILAGLDKGGYAWAKAGYGWDSNFYEAEAVTAKEQAELNIESFQADVAWAREHDPKTLSFYEGKLAQAQRQLDEASFIEAPVAIDTRLNSIIEKDFATAADWEIVEKWAEAFNSGDINLWPTPIELVSSGLKIKNGNGDFVDFGRWLMEGSSWHGTKPITDPTAANQG